MALQAQKRPADDTKDPADSDPPAKRQCLTSQASILVVEKPGASPNVSSLITPNAMARKGLERGIALALQKVGFDTARPDAMESFVSMTESYIASLVEEIKTFTNAARRSHPVPRDFEQGLKRFDLTTSLLKPHKKPPIPKSRRIPSWAPLDIDDPIFGDLPILCDELDGTPDKTAKSYIPASFPSFPSTHTYKYTPESVEAATAPDEWSAGYDEFLQSTDAKSSARPRPPLEPHEIPNGDPKKLREAAAKEATAGEGALRRLMRASKIAKQKEVRSGAQRQTARRERYALWEAAMRELIEEDSRGRGGSEEDALASSAIHGEKGRPEIADHSMLVNGERSCFRKDVPRAGGRKAVTGKSH